MIEKICNVRTADGEMETFTARPDGDGPFPAVVLYMDAPGIRGELYDFGRRIAGEGYYALVPDLYYRRGRVRLDMTLRGARKVMYGPVRTGCEDLPLRAQIPYSTSTHTSCA